MFVLGTSLGERPQRRHKTHACLKQDRFHDRRRRNHDEPPEYVTDQNPRNSVKITTEARPPQDGYRFDVVRRSFRAVKFANWRRQTKGWQEAIASHAANLARNNSWHRIQNGVTGWI